MDITVGSTLTWAWPLILTAISLVLTAFINQVSWSTRTKKAVTIAVAGFVGLVYAIASGQISEVPAEWVASLTRWLVVAAIILVFGQAVYSFFKNPLATIEAKTSIAPVPAEAESSDDDAAIAADSADDAGDTATADTADSSAAG
jgi:hypothetical protein